MSVVVRMEMPTSCEKCPACDYEEGNCLLADDRNTLPHNGRRRSWCPIICQLPEGHGRLGDLDELLNLMFHYDDYYGAKEAHDLDLIHRDSICYAIENAPTIVPAERRET